MKIGYKIRLLRERMGLTLNDMSKITQYSVSFLSQIERDKANPSINSLKNICDVLEVPLASFFDDEKFEQFTNNNVVRKENRKKLLYKESNTEMHLLTPNLDGKIEMILIIAKPGGNSGEEYHKHEGEESGYIIKGSMNVILNGKVYTLREGDSISFSSEEPHRWENISETEECVSVWAITPVSF